MCEVQHRRDHFKQDNFNAVKRCWPWPHRLQWSEPQAAPACVGPGLWPGYEVLPSCLEKKAYKQWMNWSFIRTSLIELRPLEWRLEGQRLSPCFTHTVHVKHSSIRRESGINILTVSCFSDVGNSSSAQHLFDVRPEVSILNITALLCKTNF